MQKIRTVTGERVVTPEGGFNPAWQRHVAEYRFAAGLLPQGSTMDAGCGIGHSYSLLAPRETVGVDVDGSVLSGQGRPTVRADMRHLPFADGAFESILSVHSLEHVPDPERIIAEGARVSRPEGCVIFVTPNRLTFGRPDEIIDPYHFKEFDHVELRLACLRHFPEVEVLGVFASPSYMRLHDLERAKLGVLLSLDPLRLRKLVPRKAKQFLYDALLSRARRKVDPLAASITVDDFHLGTENLAECVDLIAICRRQQV